MNLITFLTLNLRAFPITLKPVLESPVSVWLILNIVVSLLRYRLFFRPSQPVEKQVQLSSCSNTLQHATSQPVGKSNQ